MRRRGPGDIWQGLYDLPVVERPSARPTTAPPEAAATALLAAGLPAPFAGVRFEAVSPPVRTQLTHQELVMRYWRYAVDATDSPGGGGQDGVGLPGDAWRWVGPAELGQLGVPQPLLRYLSDPQLGLSL